MNEGESCIEQFAVQFKTEEVSSNFRKMFNECVAVLASISEKSSVTVPDQTGSLESQFKKKPGEWICDDCYVVNMADCKRCVSCEALKPGEKEDTVPVMSSSSIILGTTGGFQFTGKTDQSFSFNKGSFQPGATSTTTTSTSSFTTAFDLTKFGTFPANPERENDALKTLGEKRNDKDDKAGTGKAFGGQFPPKSDELVKDNAAEKKCIASETVQSEEVYDKAPASCLKGFSSVSSTFKFGSSGGFNFTSSNIVSSGKFPFGLTVKEQDSSNGGAFQSRFEVPSESEDALKPLGMMDIGVAKSDPSQPPAAGKSPEKHADECDKETDGEGTTPETSFTYYKPLVSLPEVITKSGEEDESVMFNERAKLYRFVEKQWKERGVGTMKILHNEQTDTVRILMRRDQLLKVCANHRIKADMDIDYKDSSDTKTLTWRATDYTDEVPRLEQYCCRFKTPEIASDFKETFEKAKLIAERNVTPNKSRVTQADGGSKDTPPLYTTSQSSEPVFESGVASSSGKSVFSLGSTTFGTNQTTSATNMLRSFALKRSEEKMGEHQKVFGGFTFTSPPLLTNNIPTVSKAKPDDETLSKNDDKSKPVAGFSFGSSPQKPGYGIKLDFNHRSSSPASAKLAAESIETTDSISGKLSKQVKGEENKDDFEQGNEKLFGEQGKLYVNNSESKEWKERGIGEIQILKDNTKATYRILMLREQSQKVCADHCLTKNMKLLRMDGNKKSWCWFAEDFMNESELCIKQFSVRFKTEEVSSNFRKVFDECVAALSAISEKSSVTVPDQTGSLESQFKKKPGEWICDDCYVVNMADCKRCVSCEALKPGEKEDTVPVMSSSSIILGTT
ncbi:hypothetical protein LSH36_1004g00006, partial [Paralvinella palmiformis]